MSKPLSFVKHAALFALLLFMMTMAAGPLGYVPKAQVSVSESNMTPVQFHQKYEELNRMNIYKLLSREEREQVFKSVFLSYDVLHFDRTAYSLKHRGDKVIEGLDYNLRKYVVIFSRGESMDETYLTAQPEKKIQTAQM